MSAATESTKVILDADDRTRAAFTSAQRNLDNLNKSFTSTIAVLGVGSLSLGAFAGFLRQTIDGADALNDLATRVGTSVESLASLELAAKLSDTSLENLGASLGKLSVFMANNADEAVRLGVTARDPVQAFAQFADAVAKVEDPVQRNALAMRVLGKSYQEVMPLLAQGGNSLRAQAAEAGPYAQKMSELAASAGKFHDEMDKLSIAAKGVGVSIAGSMLPSLQKMFSELNEGIRIFGGFGAALQGIGLEINPLASVQGNLSDLRAELKRLQEMQAASRPEIADMLAPQVEQVKKKLEFVKYLQRQEALALGAPFASYKIPSAPPTEGDLTSPMTAAEAAKIQAAMAKAFDTQALDDYLNKFRDTRQKITTEYAKLNTELTRGKTGEATGASDLMGELSAGRAALASGDAPGAAIAAERGKEMLRSLSDSGVIGVEGSFYARQLKELELRMVDAEEKTAQATAAALVRTMEQAKREIAEMDPVAVPLAVEAMANEIRRTVQVVREELARNPLVVPVQASWGGGAQENIVGDTLRRAALARGGR